MPVCLVVDILGKDNPLWLELVSFTPGSNDGFERWLEAEKLERTAANAAVYYRQKRMEQPSFASIQAESAGIAEQTDTSTDAFLFLEGARLKLNFHKGKPLKDTLEYGDYIGMNTDATLDIHQIGLIRGIQCDADNRPVSYTIEKVDGTIKVISADKVNRLY